ncbi:hypothetical protein ACLB2K_004684 [Fragaria x ananassa]
MERIRKGSGGGNGSAALVKAAAWAWYEHGTGLQGKSLQEFDIRRSSHDLKPSRFKLEAKKLAEQGSRDFDDRSLLDRYEIESISRRLDQLMESSGDKGKVYNKGFLVQDDSDHPGSCSSRKSKAPTSAVGDLGRKESVALSDGDYTNHRRKKTSNNFRGFLQRHAVICGSSTHKDVILGTRTFVHNRERPQYLEKRKVYPPVPVVKLANCRPKATGRYTHAL